MRGSGLLLLCVAAVLFSLWANGSAFAAEAELVHRYKVGDFEVIQLSEGESDRDPSLFVGATPELVEKYVPTGTYVTATNTFLIRTPDRLVLVDTGYGRELFKNLKAVGVKPEQIDTVLLTHMHGDHIGGLLRDGKPAFPKAAVRLARQELEYWTSEEIMKASPPDRQDRFKSSIEVTKSYGDAVQTFEPGALGSEIPELLPGIRPIAAFGHTPGHTLFMVESGGERLLIWGDLTHAMAIQMPAPEVAMTYDSDPQMAVASRLAVLKYVAENKIPIAGMHVPLPALGTVTTAADGVGYTFTPTAKR
ncbi:MAG: MBL fold metallo-hydrolase [Synergistaceae bacterium]|jgi:glyoxylase-like metal-dependent hydrolase (beta-lactamase superfamily II)|nr:MBL fold metallo-hydrolase [Synergistaceae bacterium]